MIPGAFCKPLVFDKFRARFEARGYVVHTPPLRLHDGKATWALGTTSLLDFAADLEKFVRALDTPPILLGHSMGGLLAQMLAARLDVRAAILLAPSAPWGIMPSTVFEVASAGTMFLAGDFWNQPLIPDYFIASTNSLDRLSEKECRATFAEFVPESGLATFEIMHWPFDARQAARVPARDIECPLLCIAGSDDRINPPKTVRSIAGRYGALATYKEYENHSHWLVGEPGWRKIADDALDWLDTVLAAKVKS